MKNLKKSIKYFKDNYKSIIYKFIIFTFASLTITLFIQPFTLIKADDAYDTDEYNFVVDVKEDGNYEIKENIKVNFKKERRGIYRDIPTYYTMTWNIDNEDYYRRYYFPVNNIEVDQPYVVTQGEKYVSIRIGDPDKYIIGPMEYNVSYRLRTRDLQLEGRQYFYLNLIGLGWPSVINKSTITINFPKEIDFSRFNLYAGSAYSKDTSRFTCSYDNSIYQVKCYNTKPIEGYEAITASLVLVGEANTDKAKSYFIYADASGFDKFGLLLAGLSFVIGIVSFIRYGKGSKVVRVVEFSPPKDIYATDLGYIMDGKLDRRDIVATFLEWAKDGLITIKDDKEKGLSFILRSPFPENRPKYEKKLFNKVFDGKGNIGDEVRINDLKGKLFRGFESVRDGVIKKFKVGDKKLKTNSSNVLKVIFRLLVSLPLVFVYIAAYSRFYLRLELRAFPAILPFVIAMAILTATCQKYIPYWSNLTLKKRVLAIVLILLLMFLSFNLFPKYEEFFNFQEYNLYIAGFMSMVLFILASFIDKKTTYGQMVYGRCLGLKDFIRLVEKDRLKMLVEENPAIFYDVLPYAYVLGLTKLWQNKFKGIDIEPADFYQGGVLTNTSSITNSLTTSLSSMQNFVNKDFISSGGSFFSGGFGGGSFGGGGGGGYSGGGFGGGGGGSW